jgi:hydroxyacylglutathione hydrolase
MAKRRRTLLYVWLALFVLLLVGIGVMRMGRGRFDAPKQVHGSVWDVHTNVSDIYGAKVGDGVILFDSGADPEGRPIDALLAALGTSRDKVTDVFLTHGHGDHIAGASLFGKARIHGGIGDSDMMSKRGPVLPGFARFMGVILPTAPVMITDGFLDRADVPIGSAHVLAVPFAGHTPGSMLYLYDNVLFAGDSMLYNGKKLDFGPGVFNVDSALLKKNTAALATMIELPQVKTVCTGHGGCTPEADTQRLLADFIAAQK